MARNISVAVDLDSPTPAYRQIIDGLRVCLVEGDLKPGDRVPSVRELASDLGLHFNTVAEAYRELAAEGWLRLDRGRGGARVVERDSSNTAGGDSGKLALRLHSVVAEARAGGLSVRDILNALAALQGELESALPR
jgi:GntR family transcriptional regulator